MLWRWLPRSSLLLLGGGLWVLACGSRTNLHLAPLLAAAGAEGGAGAPANEAFCQEAADCPQPSAGQCGVARCVKGACSLELAQVCDDSDPCTLDTCSASGCVFVSARVDADRDGVFATGTLMDPRARLGCGQDCDDRRPDVHPGAVERCDGVDNDCNGVVDDGAMLAPAAAAPKRVSSPTATRSHASGLAFDGRAFGATLTSEEGRSVGQFQQLDAQGGLVGRPVRIARVNTESYAGPLVWSGERYFTAYQDARQAGNYEIYLDLLNRNGERVAPDLRVTYAEHFSLRPSLLWTGVEALLVWDDRRFEDAGDASAIFGQRVKADGQLLGENVRLSPPGLHAENASAALSESGVGIAFVVLNSEGSSELRFMSTSRILGDPSPPVAIDFANADAPVVTALGDEYLVTFHRYDSVAFGPSIYGAVLGKGGVVRAPQPMTQGAAHARGNAVYSYGDRWVMVWADDRSGVLQLYAQTFDKELLPVTEVLRLTKTRSHTHGAAIAPTADGGLGVLYTDEGLAGTPQTFFTRLDCK